jgi:hypothetical protein
MGVLSSILFISGDQDTVKKLEDCATGQPSEVQSHFTIHQTGEHIKKVQEALKSVHNKNPSLGITKFSVNGIYDQEFADAIRIYKTKRDIRNFANKIDDIIGIKTIRSLDQENKSDPSPTPPTPLPPVKPDATEPRLILKKTFEQKFIVRPPADLSPDSGGIGFAIGTALNQGIKDVLRMQKNPIEGSDFDDGVVQSRETRLVNKAQVMKKVDIDEEIRELPSQVTFGSRALQFNITRIYRYSYGVGLLTEPVLVSTIRTIIPLLASRSVVRDTRTSRQPTDFLDPR